MKMLKMHQNALKCTRMRMGRINTHPLLFVVLGGNQSHLITSVLETTPTPDEPRPRL